MTIVRLNQPMYKTRMYGRGIYGRAYKLKTQKGYGIFDNLGKSASKMLLGGVGKSSGAYAGKQLGKLIGEKTGSKLLGQIAKSGLSALGGVAGNKVGSIAGNFLGDTVFGNKEKEEKERKKKKAEETPALSKLFETARNKLSGTQSGQGISIRY